MCTRFVYVREKKNQNYRLGQLEITGIIYMHTRHIPFTIYTIYIYKHIQIYKFPQIHIQYSMMI